MKKETKVEKSEIPQEPKLQKIFSTRPHIKKRAKMVFRKRLQRIENFNNEAKIKTCLRLFRKWVMAFWDQMWI